MSEPAAGTSLGAALWRLAVSPATFAVLCLLWCLDLGLGSLLAHGRADLFGSMDAHPFARWLREIGRPLLPWSGWVYLLAGLSWAMVASLLLCTVNWFWKRRRRLRALGEVLVHLGFLLVFAGYVVGAVRGERVHGVVVPRGSEVEVPGMGLALRLRALEQVRSPEGEVLDTVSELVLGGGGQGERAGSARLNHPLIRGTTVVYPRGTRELLRGAVLATPFGPVRIAAGGTAPLPDGRLLVAPGVLHTDQRQGAVQGPALALALFDARGTKLATGTLAPADGVTAVSLAGFTVALQRLETEAWGRYDVHRDPGVWLVLGGAALLFLGTVWALVQYLAGTAWRRPASG